MSEIKLRRILIMDLTDLQLDVSVAKCEYPNHDWEDLIQIGRRQRYSREWAQGGPFIDSEWIWLGGRKGGYKIAKIIGEDQEYEAWGENALIAAMRCYAISQLGYEILLPEKLFYD